MWIEVEEAESEPEESVEVSSDDTLLVSLSEVADELVSVDDEPSSLSEELLRLSCSALTALLWFATPFGSNFPFLSCRAVSLLKMPNFKSLFRMRMSTWLVLMKMPNSVCHLS